MTKSTNFLAQAEQARRAGEREARRNNVRIKAARLYLARNLLDGKVIVIHDSISLDLPEGTHPVPKVVLQAILVGGA